MYSATFFKFYMAISAVSTLQQLEISIADCEARDHLISVNHFLEHCLTNLLFSQIQLLFGILCLLQLTPVIPCGPLRNTSCNYRIY